VDAKVFRTISLVMTNLIVLAAVVNCGGGFSLGRVASSHPELCRLQKFLLSSNRRSKTAACKYQSGSKCQYRAIRFRLTLTCDKVFCDLTQEFSPPGYGFGLLP
jgi:hypothetical protein